MLATFSSQIIYITLITYWITIRFLIVYLVNYFKDKSLQNPFVIQIKKKHTFYNQFLTHLVNIHSNGAEKIILKYYIKRYS